MKTFIAIADVHLGWKLYNIPELEQDLREVFIKVINLAIEKGVAYVVIVGDLFDDNNPTPEMIAFVRQQVERANNHGVIVCGITGDHDRKVQNCSWSEICQIRPLEINEEFAGLDYQDNPKTILDYLTNHSNKPAVRWLFFHGQEVSFFKYVDEKKRLTFGDYKLFELFPNLQGVILGDIHKPIEGVITEGDKQAFIGYCGSLGVVKSDEIGSKTGILHWDGKQISRLPFAMERAFIKIDLTGKNGEVFSPDEYVEQFRNNLGKKPVFRVEYDAGSKVHLSKLNALYPIGMVKPTQVKMSQLAGNKVETLNIRSELATVEKTSDVLRTLCPDDEMYNFVYNLVKGNDPKLVLDKLVKEKL